MAVNFDTHATVKELTQAGFSEAQAEALVRAVAGQRVDLATKADLEPLKTELRLHRWVLGLLVALQLATLGLLFNLMRLV